MKTFHLEKCMRIINDLVAYCHSNGAEEFNVTLRRFASEGNGGGAAKKDVTEINVACPMPPIPEAEYESFVAKLNLPRQHEIEHDYWELSGESEMSSELSLVGMMIDEAEVRYEGGKLHITARRFAQV